MRHRLSQLMDVARDNDRLFDKTRRLVLDLLDATSLEEVVSAVEDSLRHEFQVPFVSLILFSETPTPVGRCVSSAEAHQAIGGLLAGGKTLCGVLRTDELAFLFGEQASRQRRLGGRGRAGVPGFAWRAGHRQPRSAALQKLFGHSVSQLHRRSAGPRAAALRHPAALRALNSVARRAAAFGLTGASRATMHNPLDAYLEQLRCERQVSAHTCSAYRLDLRKVLDYCQQEQLADWRALDTPRLRRLIARLHQQGLSGKSLARLLSAVRGFYQYLNRQGLCSHDPANGLTPPKGERRLPKTLDADRAKQLLDGNVEDDFLGHRDQALLELCYSSGLRLAELVA